MSEISRSTLFGKLNPMAYRAIEGATVFCKLRGNPFVELEHWVAQIVQNPDSDWHRILRYRLTPAGDCTDCGLVIPGRFAGAVDPHNVSPRPIRLS